MPPTRYRSLRYLLGGVLTYSISTLYFGYALGYFNAIEFASIHQVFNISIDLTTAQGIFSGCAPFGGLFGAFFSKFIINKLSRSQSFIFADLLAIFAGILVMIQLTQTLLIGRFLQGFTIGFSTVLVPIMVKQFSPVQLSGSFGALFPPTLGIGMFLAYLLPYLLKTKYNATQFWRYTFGLSTLIMFTQLILICTCYRNETPKYLISKNKKEQAKQLIRKIYKDEYFDIVYKQKLKDHDDVHVFTKLSTNLFVDTMGIDGQGDASTRETQLNLKIKSMQKLEQQPMDQAKEIKKQYPSDIPFAKVFGFLLQTFHQLSGINVVVIYGAKLVEDVIPSWKFEIPLIINGQKIIAGLFGTLLLGRYGRRQLMMQGNGIIFLSLLGLFLCFSLELQKSIYLEVLIITFFMIYISAFVTTLGPITWLYISQIVQPPTVPYTTMVNWIFSCLVITLFPLLKPYTTYLLLFFSLNLLLNQIMCYYFMIETKGKTELRIREEFIVINKKIVSDIRAYKNRILGRREVQQQNFS